MHRVVTVIETGKRMVVTRGWGRGNGCYCLIGITVSTSEVLVTVKLVGTCVEDAWVDGRTGGWVDG